MPICLEGHKSPTNSFSYTTRQLNKHILYNPKITQYYIQWGYIFFFCLKWSLIFSYLKDYTKQILSKCKLLWQRVYSLSLLVQTIGLTDYLALVYVFQG